MSDSSRYIYMPASAQSSRRIIEQSSYTTTPDQSSTATTPPCGETVYKRSLDAENIRAVDSILTMEQTSDTKSFEPPRRQISMIEQNKKNKPKKPAQGERSKMGTNGVEEGLEGKKTAVNPDKSSISETCI